MVKAEIVDVIGEVNPSPEDLITKMVQLAREVTNEVASKFSGGRLEIYGQPKHERKVGVMYLPPKKHWYDFLTARVFINFKNEGIEEIFVTVSSDPKYISDELVEYTKKLISKRAAKLNVKIKGI
jgi:hypothetical protein